jgi:hypothetical protein
MFDVKSIIQQNMPQIKKGILKELVLDKEFRKDFKKALGIKDMPQIKKGILEELVLDKEFREDFKKALGIKENVIVLNGATSIEVLK